ncbi:MAG TPA: GNAT family N-acetyltransferase [Devosiaceae bacterium]|nr:GNAT family N-acetyltransferase [Devosiaceae bacterium]
MLEIKRLESFAALEALEEPWWGLWRQSPAATPFQSPAWLLPWWCAFAPGRLSSVAVWRDGSLAALAPLYLEDGPLGRRVLPLGIGISDYLDVLVRPGDAEAAMALSQGIAALENWDSIELEQLSPGAAGRELPCPQGCVETRAPQDACPGLAIGPDVDESGLPYDIPGKRRQHYRRKCRAAAAHPPVEITAPDPRCFVDQLAALHGARWQEKGEPGVMADPRVVAFHREAAPELARRGLARFLNISLEGRLAGALYVLAWRDRVATYLSGFDPEFAEVSPVTLLCGEMLRAAVGEGVRDVSFLRGREPYKYHWGATDRWNHRRSFRRA